MGFFKQKKAKEKDDINFQIEFLIFLEKSVVSIHTEISHLLLYVNSISTQKEMEESNFQIREKNNLLKKNITYLNKGFKKILLSKNLSDEFKMDINNLFIGKSLHIFFIEDYKNYKRELLNLKDQFDEINKELSILIKKYSSK